MVSKSSQPDPAPEEDGSGQAGQKPSCPLLDSLNESFLPKNDGYPNSFNSVNLNMLIKLIYFEQQSNYEKVTMKDLENFKEEDLYQNQPEGGDLDWSSMLNMMGMGGGGGSGDVDQLLRGLAGPNL